MMKQVYDGLEYMRIPVDTADIFTSSLDNCMQNVLNIMPENVCVSQTQGEVYCSEYNHTRSTEYLTPRAPGQTVAC